jgi:mxaK protein
MGLRRALPSLVSLAPRAAIVLLVLACAAALFDLAAWWRVAQLERRIATIAGTPLADDEPPELRFARAAQLGATGDYDTAIALYRSLHLHPTLGVPARYNAGNVLMRQAMQLRQSPSTAGQAVTLLELAKQQYRDTLRLDPDHWDARYNHERAQRLQPDPELSDAVISEPRSAAERATTTSRGVAPGLP